MAAPKRKILLVGITYIGDALLLGPADNSFDLPTFPIQKNKDKLILKQLADAGYSRPHIVSKLDPIEITVEDAPVTLCPVVFAFDGMNKDYVTLSFDPKPEKIPYLASLFYWRAEVYAPAYRGFKRTVPFLPPQAKQVERELACLEHHAKLLSKQDLADFRLLCASPASIRRINEAFVALCNQYHIHPNNFSEGSEKA